MCVYDVVLTERERESWRHVKSVWKDYIRTRRVWIIIRKIFHGRSCNDLYKTSRDETRRSVRRGKSIISLQYNVSHDFPRRRENCGTYRWKQRVRAAADLFRCSSATRCHDVIRILIDLAVLAVRATETPKRSAETATVDQRRKRIISVCGLSYHFHKHNWISTILLLYSWSPDPTLQLIRLAASRRNPSLHLFVVYRSERGFCHSFLITTTLSGKWLTRQTRIFSFEMSLPRGRRGSFLDMYSVYVYNNTIILHFIVITDVLIMFV